MFPCWRICKKHLLNSPPSRAALRNQAHEYGNHLTNHIYLFPIFEALTARA